VNLVNNTGTTIISPAASGDYRTTSVGFNALWEEQSTLSGANNTVSSGTGAADKHRELRAGISFRASRHGGANGLVLSSTTAAFP